ncbi:MAG TPA: winged helix-turn-helix domain-containing protein, partial [Xanthomonadales bacterium]|nr:winged helix-turn-helix domain-containing protein [Xanthomonadales bacterium]
MLRIVVVAAAASLVSATVQPIRRPSDWRYARLEGWIVDVPANRVQRGGEELRLTPKAMAVLRELMQRQGAVVRRDDLLGIVWRDGFPTDDVLTHAVTELRRALEVDPRSPRIIETIPKVGYRLVPPVELLAELPAEAAPAAEVVEGDPPRRPLALLVALAAFVLLSVLVPTLRRPALDSVQSAPAVPQRLDPFAVTADPVREQFPSVSPDGSTVAYASMAPDRPATRIMLKSLDAAAVPVPLTSGAEGSDDQPVWSPDGKKIAFLRTTAGECSIQVMPALGGQARRVGYCSARTLDYLDWSADGRALLVARRRGDSASSDEARAATVHRLEIETGAELPIDYAPLPQGEDDLQPRASPDGRWIAFRRGAIPYSDLWVMPAEGGQARRVTRLRA